MTGEAALLELVDLSISFPRGKSRINAVRDFNLSIAAGETVALVGESGSGKSITSLAIMRLLAGAEVSGQVLWRENGEVRQLLDLPARDMRNIRGARIAMIFQEPMTSLNPVHTVGRQITEALLLHSRVGHRKARKAAEEHLTLVGIPDAARRLDVYPHEMSGGMRQRVMIAMSLICNPALLIADEPTTALDVTIQAQILDLLRQLKSRLGMSMLFISHDFGVVADIADRIAVMYAGEIVEQGTARDVLAAPSHPYTRALLDSIPRLTGPKGRLPAIKGSMPDLTALPPGCRFAPRCAFAVSGLCDADRPDLMRTDKDTEVRCVRWRDMPREAAHA